MVDIAARQIPVYAFEFLAVGAGLVVWWKFQFSCESATFRTPRLPHWAITSTTFLLVCIFVIAGALIGGALTQLALFILPKSAHPNPDFSLMLTNLGLHLGVFATALVSPRFARALAFEAPPAPEPAQQPALAPPLSARASIWAGVLTFLAVLPLVGLVSLTWQALLDLAGIATEKQEMLDLFGKTQEPAKLILMTAMATVLAPLSEELAFRAGIFRFLRGRIPPIWAYILPAAFFAVLHNNLSVFVPLFTLGLFFSLVYQRTGRVLVTIVAHGLFNLNTVLVVLSGANL